MPNVSVILPVYNEAAIIARVFAEVAAFVRGRSGDDQFIFVDDGSKDGTADRIQALIDESGLEQIELLRCTRNGGKGRAIKIGIDQCKAPLICFTDGDLAYPLKSIDDLTRSLADHQVAVGSRHLDGTRQRNIHLHRKLLGWGFNKLVRVILSLPYRDTQAGLKGFHADAARAIFARQRVTGFAFDAELIFLAKRLGYRIGEVPAIVSEEHSYKVSTMNMWRDPFKMLLSVSRVRFNAIMGRYAKPDPAEFRRGGVRHPAGVRPSGVGGGAVHGGGPRAGDHPHAAATPRYPIHVVHDGSLRRPSAPAHEAGRSRA